MKKLNKHTEVTARREGLVVQEMPDETLVYDLNRHSAHCLNETAAFVWNHCDGGTHPAEIAEMMSKKWRKKVSEDLVWLALKQLKRANLLENPPARHAGKIDASRRAAVQKLGLAAALSLPVVTSIVSPTAAASASVPVVCLGCIDRGFGNPFTEVCTGTCGDYFGTCYKNSGCGAGQEQGCITCKACNQLSIDNPNQAKSWKSPGGAC